MYKVIGADGKEYGPVSLEMLRQWVAEGRANAQTNVLAPGAAGWKPLAQVPELAPLLHTSVIAPLTPVPCSPAARSQTNTMALAGFIFGLISITFGLCCYGFPFNLLGIVFSLIGLSQIRRDPQTQQGKALAIAGLVISLLSLLLVLVWIARGFAFGGPELWRKIHRL